MEEIAVALKQGAELAYDVAKNLEAWVHELAYWVSDVDEQDPQRQKILAECWRKAEMRIDLFTAACHQALRPGDEPVDVVALTVRQA